MNESQAILRLASLRRYLVDALGVASGHPQLIERLMDDSEAISMGIHALDRQAETLAMEEVERQEKER